MNRLARAGAVALAGTLAAAALAGCGEDDKPRQAMDAIEAPSWFTEPEDAAEPGADPPRWTRTYRGLPKSRSDVEFAYSLSLDRAGWRYRAGDCPQAPSGGRIKADCWLNDGMVLAITSRSERPGQSEGAGPTRLDVVLHLAADSAR